MVNVAQSAVPPPVTRFTVWHPFVRLRFSSFCQFMRDQAGIRGGNGPADIHPFHWPTMEYPSLPSSRIIPVIPCFIGNSGLFLDGFMHIPETDSSDSSGQTPTQAGLNLTLISGYSHHPEVSKGVFLTRKETSLPPWVGVY